MQRRNVHLPRMGPLRAALGVGVIALGVCLGTARLANAGCHVDSGGVPDGNLQPGELCDDGNLVDTDNCRNDCTLPACGDTVIQDRGNCRSPYDAMNCLDDGECPIASAGCDNAGIESCDPPFALGGLIGCSDSCVNACGNAAADAGAGEQCDGASFASGFADCSDRSTCVGGAANDGAACAADSDCASTTCDPQTSQPTTCNADCTASFAGCANCGDGVVEGFEACERPFSQGGAVGCTNNCGNQCGNGRVETALGEQCDGTRFDRNFDDCNDRSTCVGGGTNDGAACAVDSDCDSDHCDPQTSADTTCAADCTVNFDACGNCGDGVIQRPDEDCDPPFSAVCHGGDRDGEPCTSEADCLLGGTCGRNRGCSRDCTRSDCGDGVVDRSAGEACDNGASECYSFGSADGAECGTTAGRAACEIGDGRCGPRGQGDCLSRCTRCDATNCNADTLRDACTTDCSMSYCGDGKADTAELCDDGVASGDPEVRDESDELDDCPNGPATLANGSACRVSPTCGDARQHLFRSACDDGAVAGTQCTRACGTPPELCDNGGGAALVCLLMPAQSSADCLAIGGTPGPLTDDCFVDREATCAEDPTVLCGADSDCAGGATGPCGNSDVTPNACRGECTLPRCGDDVVDRGEGCDGGDAVCAAGSPDEGEACGRDDDCDDDPPCDADEVDCRETCVDASGTTGEPDAGLACEADGEAGVAGTRCAGGTDAGTTCVAGSDCESDRCEGVCNNTLPAGCHACATPACGDAVVDLDLGEECDRGPDNGVGRPCTDTCFTNVCGDAKACTDGLCTSGPGGGPEECDDGNGDETDACQGDCALNVCGDGVRRFTEPVQLCDDGNTLDWDGCSAACCPESADAVTALPEKLAAFRCNQQRLGGLIEELPEASWCSARVKRQLGRLLTRLSLRQEQAEARCEVDDLSRCCRYLGFAEVMADRIGRLAVRMIDRACLEPTAGARINSLAATVVQIDSRARSELCL